MSLKKRIYEDYLKKSRLHDYQDILSYAKDNDYQMIGILDFYRLCSANQINANIKYLLNRHDIDTSPAIARKMFDIEKKVYGSNASVTYYFRWSTIDKKLIQEIERYGYETGYHYEEIADYEKKIKNKNSEAIFRSIPNVQKIFLKRFNKYKQVTGTNSLSVASHGDFINTIYGIQNYELLRNAEFLRKNVEIEVEAYDDSFVRHVNARFADQVLLEKFSKNVENAILNNEKVVMLLTHPRNWEVDVWANSKENLKRLYQGIKYKL